MSSFESPNALRWVIDDLAYHQTRVLLLVDAVAGAVGNAKKLDGLTKLAKLDFLLRYPALANLVLDNLNIDDARMHLSPKQVSAPTDVDDPMVRYKYGPWDDRYYPVVGALVSRGLLKYAKGRRGSVALSMTPAGKNLAKSLRGDPLWSEVADRCDAVAEASSGMSGNAIKELIYRRLPALMNRPHRQEI